jgi:hypothetical protein
MFPTYGAEVLIIFLSVSMGYKSDKCYSPFLHMWQMEEKSVDMYCHFTLLYEQNFSPVSSNLSL